MEKKLDNIKQTYQQKLAHLPTTHFSKQGRSKTYVNSTFANGTYANERKRQSISGFSFADEPDLESEQGMQQTQYKTVSPVKMSEPSIGMNTRE